MEKTVDRLLVRLTVPAVTDSLSTVMAVVRDLALRHGFDDLQAGRLEVMAEEACGNVIKHAFEPGTENTFDLMVLRRPGQLVFAVEDQGLPFDVEKVEAGKEPGLGVQLMRAFADELRFINLGPGGKRVEMRKDLPAKSAGEYPEIPEPVEPPEDAHVDLRLMRPDESVALARCAWRVYGYTYMHVDIYYPDRLRESLESGLMTSIVAVTDDGEIIGHVAAVKTTLESRVAESAIAFVIPAWRGRSFFKTMKTMLIDRSREAGLLGLYSEAMTVHPFTQKGNLSLGAVETGFQPGYMPAHVTMKAIAEEITERLALMLMYLRLIKEPNRTIYPPYEHGDIIKRICQRLEMDRSVADEPSLSPGSGQPSSRLDVHGYADLGLASLTLVEYGADFYGRLRYLQREFQVAGVEVMSLDIPLSEPFAPAACAAAEELGFFFAGIIPEYLPSGDALRLMFVGAVRVDLDRATTASEFGAEIKDYVCRRYLAATQG